MDIRGPDRASNAPCCLDLLRGHLPLSIGVLFGLDSCPHPRIAGCRGDDLFMAVGSGSGSICDLPSFRRSSRVFELHRRIRRHHRNRNDLVVACSEQQVLKWTIEAGDPIDQLNAHSNRASCGSQGCAPQSFLGRASDRHHRNRGAIATVKVRTYDNSLYILLFDEIRDQWELIMFCAAPAQGWQRKHHDLARSTQSCQ